MSQQNPPFPAHSNVDVSLTTVGDAFIEAPVIYYVPEEDFTFIAHPTELDELVVVEYFNQDDMFMILTDELKKLKYYPMGYL